ncbi:MAG TPA: histidine kinase [Syntrophomonas sp.]|jgi:acetoin utilization protein AcuB|nr:histidine kinase [Syntrophomonas sp.]
MKVKDRMSTDVKTATMDTSLMEALHMMEENSIRRIPIMDKTKLVGIVTLSDLNRAAPSAVTSLSIHEINYLLGKTKLKDIVPKKQQVITIGSENYIETAAKVMRANNVSGLPVVDDGRLVGIVTETNIFDALIDILGVYQAHSRLDLYVPDGQGRLAEITGIISKMGINILNAVAYYDEKKNLYKIIIRIEELDTAALAEELKSHGYQVDSVLVVEDTER